MHVLRVLLTTVILTGPLAAWADICNRTEAIKLAIMQQLAKSDCRQVSSFDLQLLKTLDLSLKGLEGHLQGDDLVGLTSLQRLYLRNNHLTSIEGLGALTSLELLDLRNNHLTSIDGLGALTSLQIIFLDNNHLTSIEGLEAPTSLELLDLRNNRLTSIDGLGALTSLQWLDLRNNQLTSLEGPEIPASLRMLFLRGNPISDDLEKKKWCSLDYIYCG